MLCVSRDHKHRLTNSAGIPSSNQNCDASTNHKRQIFSTTQVRADLKDLHSTRNSSANFLCITMHAIKEKASRWVFCALGKNDLLHSVVRLAFSAEEKVEVSFPVVAQ